MVTGPTRKEVAKTAEAKSTLQLSLITLESLVAAHAYVRLGPCAKLGRDGKVCPTGCWDSESAGEERCKVQQLGLVGAVGDSIGSCGGR